MSENLSEQQKKAWFEAGIFAEKARSARFFTFVWAAMGTFALVTNPVPEKSEYTLRQDFLRAAVEDQINDQSSRARADLVNQMTERIRQGDAAAVIPYKFEGSVSAVEAEKAVPGKMEQYKKDSTGVQSYLRQGGYFLFLLAFLSLIGARAAQYRQREALARTKVQGPGPGPGPG